MYSYNKNCKIEACEFEFRLELLSQNLIDGKSKYPFNKDLESDAYEYSVIPEQKSTNFCLFVQYTLK